MGAYALLNAATAQPALGAVAVVTDNNNDLATVPTRAIYVGVAGDVKVDMADGSTATFKAVPVGTLWVQVKRIYATGTAATNILALY